MPTGAACDYQLGGDYAPPPGTAVVVRDSTAAPAAGLDNVCYVNNFQTQPTERATWLEQRRDLVLTGADARPLVDENRPDELIVDTSTEVNRRRLAEVVGRTVQLCARKGYQAVEIDNLDSGPGRSVVARGKGERTQQAARQLGAGVHARGRSARAGPAGAGGAGGVEVAPSVVGRLAGDAGRGADPLPGHAVGAGEGDGLVEQLAGGAVGGGRVVHVQLGQRGVQMGLRGMTATTPSSAEWFAVKEFEGVILVNHGEGRWRIEIGTADSEDVTGIVDLGTGLCFRRQAA